MKRFKHNDIQLSYRDEGSGKPIIFLHAFPLNQTMWDGQVAAFSPNYRVVTFDWRGFGNSSLGDGNSMMSVFAGDLAGLIDELAIDQATICGLSMGGYAAFAFYREYAHRVSTLILADTRATTDNEEGKRGRYEMAELVRSKGVSTLAEILIPRLVGTTTLEANPRVAEQVRQMIETNSPEGIAQALLGMAERQDSTDLLPQINCPTLIIVGSEDKLTPPSEAERMNDAISGSILEIIQDAGHLTSLEQPAVFNRVMSNFLSKH